MYRPESATRGAGAEAPRRRFKISALTVATTLLVAAFAGLASAQTVDGFELTIPLDTVRTGAEGDQLILATEPVPAQFAGQSCEVTAISNNPDSVHLNNDLWVASGASVVILENVEDEPGGTVQAAGTLVLDSEVTVTLHLGPDGVFSAGLDVVVDCAGQATTTTIAATTTSTIAPTTTTTTIAATTITAPPEVTTSTVADEVLGTEVTSTTVADEVEAVDVLPLTGSAEGGWLFLAGSLLALGGILVVGSRREEG